MESRDPERVTFEDEKEEDDEVFVTMTKSKIGLNVNAI